MSLNKDNLLLKDLDFENSLEMEQIYQGYKPAEFLGRFSKNSLDYLLKIYKGCCGEGSGINKVYDALLQYIRVNIANEDYAFADEAVKLQDLYLSANEYSKELAQLNQELDSVIDDWRGSVNLNKLNEKQRAEDMKYVAQSALLFNRQSFVHAIKLYVNLLMRGCLEYEDTPDANSDASLGAFELPIFTHIPTAEDISKNALGESKLMQILYNLAETDSQLIMSMLHDCNNGKAIVRLWKKENGIDKPYLFVLSKGDIYIERIAYKREKSLWPSLIETAIRYMDCPQEEIPYAVLGPKYEDYDLSTLQEKNIPDGHKVGQNYNDMVNEYVMCYYDAYSALFGMQSIACKTTIQYIRLAIAIWEVIYALVCCLNSSIDAIEPAIEFLKSVMAEYKESVQKNSRFNPVARQGIEICDTLEKLMELGNDESEYRSKPRKYFEKNLAEKIAKVVLGSTHEEETPQVVEEGTAAILGSKLFKRQIAIIGIHEMNTASDEYAAALLKKMKTEIKRD